MRKTAPALSFVTGVAQGPLNEGLRGHRASLWAWPCLLLGGLVGAYVAGGLDGHHGLSDQLLRGPHIDTLTRQGARLPDRIAGGEVHRLVLCLFLHTGPTHLVSNLVWLLGLGVLIQRWLSGPSMVAFALLSGIAGQLAGATLVDAPSVGASPMVYGLAVGLAGLCWRDRRTLPAPVRRHLPTLLLLGAAVMVVSPWLGDRVDHAGHLGGALGGWALLAVCQDRRRWSPLCLAVALMVTAAAGAQALWPAAATADSVVAIEETSDGLVLPAAGAPGRLTWAGCATDSADLTQNPNCRTDGASWVVAEGRLDQVLTQQPLIAQHLPPAGRCVATIHDGDEVLWWIRPNPAQVIVLATTRSSWDQHRPLREALSAGRCPRR